MCGGDCSCPSLAITSTATGLKSFALFRFLLGSGEAANWPGATKTVAEWFPKSERGWAVALFDSGSAVGGAVAPLLVIGLSDNVLKPLLMGKGSAVPMLVIFLGAIGGFVFSGFIGLFTGAIVLSEGYRLMMLWIDEGQS